MFLFDISLKTFHWNVFKITAQQTGHRAERSCSLRPRKAGAFLTHIPRAPKAWRREFRCLRTATQRATRPLRTPRQLEQPDGATVPESFCVSTMSNYRKKAELFPQFDLLLFVFRKLIPTPQIALQIRQFCLGDLSCGISIIHFVLYCTWLLMLRYHFVSTFDNELCNLWRQCVPGGLRLIWYYSAG